MDQGLSAERGARVKELFGEVLDRPPEQRLAFLRQECGSDDALRSEVLELVAAYEAEPGLFSVPPFDFAGLQAYVAWGMQPKCGRAPDGRSPGATKPCTERATAPASPDTIEHRSGVPPELSEIIAGFRLLEPLGSGGMGTVYRAEEEGSGHVVAVKVIKRDAASPEALERLEQEFRVLAAMKHANIAQFHTGGIRRGPEGPLPYFAMEYVEKAESAVNYADAHKLGLYRRLELFLKICDGVSYAHQRGVIHRDLKPANILVGESGEPKIIDFGVARVTNRELVLSNIRQTRPGEFAGTYMWASPEQFGGDVHNIDIRTDVYSLGVVLYELLTGRLPFAASTLIQLWRQKLDEEPRWPSALVGTSTPPASWVHRITDGIRKVARRHSSGGVGFPPVSPHANPHKSSGSVTLTASLSAEPPDPSSYDAVEAARQRGLEPGGLTRALRGDLDWIVSKCLERDRSRRFASVDKLTDAIRCHINHLPIPERPSPMWERACKSARRHKGLAVSGAVVILTLALGFAGTVWQAVRATRQRDRALRAEQATASVQSFLLDDMVGSADPERAQGADLTVREVLDEAARRVGTRFRDQPQAAAALRETIGRTYCGLGLYEEAEDQLREAKKLREPMLAEEPHNYIAVLRNLAEVLRGTGQFDEAQSICEQALALSRSALGPEHVEVALSLIALGDVQFYRKDLGMAKSLYQQAEQILRRCPSGHQRELGEVLQRLATLHHETGEDEIARSLFEQAIMSAQALDDELLETDILNDFANFLRAKDDLQGTEQMHRSVLAHLRNTLGSRNLRVAHSLMNVAALLRERHERGDPIAYDEINELYYEARQIVHDLLGDQHREYGDMLFASGWALLEQGELDRAEELIRHSLDIWEHTYQDDWLVHEARSVLGECLTKRGLYEQAEPLVLEGYPAVREKLRDGHRRTRMAKYRIIELYEAWGKPQAAVDYFAQFTVSPGEREQP